MPRKKTFQTFREAQKIGPYAEMPMLPDDIQIQLRLSRNDRAQPFFALFSRDTLLLLMSGGGQLEFREAPMRTFSLEPGDCVYVPAGVPHRLLHNAESVVLRHVPQEPMLEGVAWVCEKCDRELHREIWNTAERLSQEAFAMACAAFNADERSRTCQNCGALYPLIEVSPFGWGEAAELARVTRDDRQKP